MDAEMRQKRTNNQNTRFSKKTQPTRFSFHTHCTHVYISPNITVCNIRYLRKVYNSLRRRPMTTTYEPVTLVWIEIANNRQPDSQTDSQTDRQTDRHQLQRGPVDGLLQSRLVDSARDPERFESCTADVHQLSTVHLVTHESLLMFTHA